MNPIKSWISKKIDLEVWGLKTKFDPLGPRHIRSEVQNPSPNFHKQDLKNHEMNSIKLWNLKKYLDLGVWGPENIFGPLGLRGPEDASRHISPEPSFNFHKQDHIFSRIMRWINKIMKSQKIFWPWCLGPRNYIWATWVRKTDISSHKSRTLAPIFPNRIYFLKNHEINPIKLWNLEQFLDLGSKASKLHSRHLGPDVSITFEAMLSHCSF